MNKLESLYHAVPKIKCVEGCTKCCGPVMLSEHERKVLGLDKNYTPWDENYNCKFIANGKCSVYSKRPFTCRLFGCSVDKPFSCPVREKADLPAGTLSIEESMGMMEYYFNLLVEDGIQGPDAFDALNKASLEHDMRVGFIPIPENMPDIECIECTETLPGAMCPHCKKLVCRDCWPAHEYNCLYKERARLAAESVLREKEQEKAKDMKQEKKESRQQDS